MKDYQAACTGARPAPEHISLQAKYLGALRTIAARLRRPHLLSLLHFSAVKLPSDSKCLCSRQRLWAPCWQHSRQRLSTPKTFTIWRSSSVHWHGVFLGRKACVFEGGRIVKKLGAALSRRLALCPPVVIQLQQRRLKWLRRQLIWEESTGHPSPPLAAIFGRAPSEDRWDVITHRASPSRDCWAPTDLADLEYGPGTRPMVHAE